ncbi:MAG: Crp/Fnr family transcriptional regulator [Sphingomonadales bacterium]|jgi:CRP-like cAMP-binding protein|nr:Crp/Fnr family transcriptional regulator [Sphingomonadales bacterium]
MSVPQNSTRNILLQAMSGDDYAILEPHFKRIPLPVKLQLHAAGRAIDYVYFPEDGIVSIVAVTLDGKSCEVGLFGREGMSETATVLGTDHSPHEAYVQSAGVSGLRLPTQILNDAFEQSPTLRRHLLRYVQAMMIQLSSSITAAGQTIEQRLARWLLMCSDRIDGNEVPLTHEFISMMLGVRRPGVTVAVEQLVTNRLIANRRGIIVVEDRAGLQRLAGGSYGLAETEYERLVGRPLKKELDVAPA